MSTTRQRTSANLSVRLQHDPGTQVVEDEHLVGLGDAQFPRQPGTLDARPAAGSRASVVSRDHNVLSLALRFNIRILCIILP